MCTLPFGQLNTAFMMPWKFHLGTLSHSKNTINVRSDALSTLISQALQVVVLEVVVGAIVIVVVELVNFALVLLE